MLPLKEKDKPVVQKLLSAGCCARCVLRFCCVSVQAAYRKPHQETLKELQAFIGNTENGKSQDSVAADSTEENNKSHDATVPEPADEPADDPPSKRAKLELSGTEAPSEEDAAEEKLTEEPSVCVVCLGILQELCGTTQAVKIAEKHSCWLHVKKELREKSMVVDKDDVVQVKEAFKWVLQGLVAKEIGGVAVVARSLFEISVGFTHQETDADCHFLATTCADCFRPTKNKQSVFTRMAVVKALEKISDTKFLTHYAWRYNKYSRSLPQTPWVIDGERRMESSVEELIAESVLSSFRSEGFNFSSSGREDVDVRTLGTGRPFAMELLNPHRSKLSREEMKLLQETINNSSDKIKVRDLQIVSREAMGKMKEGEEDKTKSYTALVWTLKPIQSEDIAFINDIKDLTLDQKTPLRVLHRRALAVRPRVVHSMKTRFLDSHHFYLEMKTQAGTYIKEFVHGDFGRTKPNLCELLKTDTDILELDVEVRGN
ncbi:putative tRNA pseudouridine synthase Pus10 [Dissostichus eleginoides]|uniref:tRNA pseudouridine synthase Pus10 n=1 Tax=Dissostichus eleginoides TaxID=100907 RepID=A0AAD9BNC1_DISEL|nr:putative tRNA pseudouridine synthase Pus10 [Dissostichus eleginoides]